MRVREQWAGRRVAVVASLAMLAVLVSGCTPAGPGALVQLSNLGAVSSGPPPVRTCLRRGRSRCRAVARCTSSATTPVAAASTTASTRWRRACCRSSRAPARGGFSGDGGPAKAAMLPEPPGALDRQHRPLHRRHREQPRAQGQRLDRDHHHHRRQRPHRAQLQQHRHPRPPRGALQPLGATAPAASTSATASAAPTSTSPPTRSRATSTHSQHFAVDPCAQHLQLRRLGRPPAVDDLPGADPAATRTTAPPASRTPAAPPAGSDADGTPALDALPPQRPIVGLATDAAGNLYVSPDLRMLRSRAHRVHRRRDRARCTASRGFDGLRAEDASIAVAPNGDLYAAG